MLCSRNLPSVIGMLHAFGKCRGDTIDDSSSMALKGSRGLVEFSVHEVERTVARRGIRWTMVLDVDFVGL